jgi:hypothetical protein
LKKLLQIVPRRVHALILLPAVHILFFSLEAYVPGTLYLAGAAAVFDTLLGSVGRGNRPLNLRRFNVKISPSPGSRSRYSWLAYANWMDA